MNFKIFSLLLILFPQCFSTPSSAMESEELPSGSSTRSVSSIFKEGNQFRSRSNPDVYLEYADSIDAEKVFEFPVRYSGFKIFRTSKNDEIGYILPNYMPQQGEIRIGAVWINEDMRRKGYCTRAILTLFSVYTAKRNYFPAAKYFTFISKSDNQAMIKVAQKTAFTKADHQDTFAAMLSGVTFKRSF